jgi:O-antigen ligase
MMEKLSNIVKLSSLYIFLGLLAYMPLHILLSTWIGTSFEILDFAKGFKDGALVLGFLLALGASVRHAWFKALLKDKLVWLIIAYAALTLFLALVKPTDQDAEILGVVYNTRFLLFFLYAGLLVHLFPAKKLRWLSIKTVLASGLIVVLFGIVQYLVLPNDALSHIGYSRENGVLPAFFIDDKPDLERVMSTLRDPNSLGSYLIIVGMVAAGIMFATKHRRREYQMGLYIMLTLFCLWFTFSRSALLGFMLASVVFIFLSEHRLTHVLRKHRKPILLVTLVGSLVLVSSLYVARNTYLVQNVILHSDQNTVLEDPNELRVRFWQESVLAINLQPEGRGPGTAGLASIKNDVQGTTLSENYYLQIGEEVGVLGMLLFLAILVVIARRLYWHRDSELAVGLLAAFVGLAFTNFLVHIWSNEAVAYTWWGLAGILLADKHAKIKIKVKKGKK